MLSNLTFCALALVCSILFSGHASSFDAYLEDRSRPVRVTDSIHTWQAPSELDLRAVSGEYYVFQTVVAAHSDLNDLRVSFGRCSRPLTAARFTCFNRNVHVREGKLQPLWIGVDLNGVRPGIYSGRVKLRNGKSRAVLPFSITVEDGEIAENGCSEGWRLSRLKWLDSDLGCEREITRPFIPLKREGNRLSLLGREMTIGADGLPSSVRTYFNQSVETLNETAEDILAAPVSFIAMMTDSSETVFKTRRKTRFSDADDVISWCGSSRSDHLSMDCRGTLEYDGYVRYEISVTSLKKQDVGDFVLRIPFTDDKSRYAMGLGLEGGFRPKGSFDWNWDVSKNQDNFWMGDVNGGIDLKLMDTNYRHQLVNIYYKYGPLKEPVSWGNGGKGGVRVREIDGGVMLEAYCGARAMERGETLHFDFELLVTPFKLIDREIRYGDRYYHGDPNDEMEKLDVAHSAGANVVNIHHAESHYPFINYPYQDLGVDTLRMVASRAHSLGQRLKVYYTTREITKNFPEFWAFDSMQGDIIFSGPGNDCRTIIHPDGPARWLCDSLKENYVPAWYNEIYDGIYKGWTDLSVLTNPDGRMNNFYIGGLDWMLRNLGIDGVYIDDSAMDRVTLRRARRLIDRYSPQGRIDFHSWNHFCEAAGWANCASLYMGLMPYFDQSWIGEGRDYDRMPDHWLIEASTIPFGVPGQMLQDGGNKWRGMLFGMTNRAGWCDDGPEPIWEFWDRYDIKSKEMIGFWDDRCPVSTGDDMVKATVYQGDGVVILAAACWGDVDRTVDLEVDWSRVGISREAAVIFRPEIERFQSAEAVSSLQQVRIPRGKGFVWVITEGSRQF